VPDITPAVLAEMVSKYRDVRRRVWKDSTRHEDTSAPAHAANQRSLRGEISRICDSARLERFAGTDEAAANLLWHEMWTKIRYAGFKAQIARDEIDSLQMAPGSFDDFRMFTSSDWDIGGTPGGWKVDPSASGPMAAACLEKTGVYADRHVVANAPKLKKTVAVARALVAFLERKEPVASVSDFVTGGDRDPWLVLAHLESTGYTGALTRLHLLMDIGFPFVKPDIVLTSLFLKWGWLHQANHTLPPLRKIDLLGKGEFGSRYSYMQPRMFELAIQVARLVAAEAKADDLRNDIGWCTENPLRELDLFLVKAGQEPERQFGIVTQIESLDGEEGGDSSVTRGKRTKSCTVRGRAQLEEVDRPRNGKQRDNNESVQRIRQFRIKEKLEDWRETLRKHEGELGCHIGAVDLSKPWEPALVIKLFEPFGLRLVKRPSERTDVSPLFCASSHRVRKQFVLRAEGRSVLKELEGRNLRNRDGAFPYFYLAKYRKVRLGDTAAVIDAIEFFKTLMKGAGS
jgi:hypothetical protein